ncbi:MAG TPA: hypothetical protein VER58_00835 [Thermoanaerobaculia bacterium]|nr:hypothetical protein [Thermoanaerobaculia bacterium]
MSPDTPDRSDLLLPLFLISAALIAVVPLLHPVGTCTDWLEKWGEASMIMKSWVRIHEMAMIGFALAAMIGIFYPFVTPRSPIAMLGGASMGGGFIIASLSILIHATSTSFLGHAFMSTRVPADKAMIRTVAEAFVAYDVGATAASSTLISAGCVLLVLSMYARRIMSPLPALFFSALGLVWAFQYHRVFNLLGFSLTEALHWASMSLWLTGIGLFLYLRQRKPAPRGATQLELAPEAHVATTAD